MVLVLTAMLMLVFLIVVAMVIDLGQGRFARRANQSAVDLAATAAGYYLAGNGNGETVALDARRACNAAVASASVNLEVTFTAVGSGCAAFPTGAEGSTCEPTDDLLARYRAGTTFVLNIEYPVQPTEIRESRFAGAGAGTDDGTDPCRLMRVSIDRTDATNFAQVIGVEEVRTNASAVVKAGPASESEGIAALLLLEREGCGVLQTSGQGAVIVRRIQVSPTEQQPGAISADSAGSTTAYGSGLECKQVTNQTGYAIYGTARPAGAGPSITAEGTLSPSGTENSDGIIGSYALEVGGRAACCRPDGLNVDPQVTTITSRTPADERYGTAIAALHDTGYASTVTNGATTTGLTDCAPADGTVFDGDGSPIVMNCPTGFNVANGQTVRFEDAPSVDFVGSVTVSGSLQVQDAATVAVRRPTPDGQARLVVSGTASFDDVARLRVGGTPSTCNNVNNCSALRVTGTLRVNTGDIGTATCANGPGATPAGEAENWTTLSTFGGDMAVTGSVSLCQTTVYVGRSTPLYDLDDYIRTVGGVNCSLEGKPCPLLSTDDSRNRFSLSGGGSFIRWTAPNQTQDPPDTDNPFESLSLWTEGTGLSQIKGTGDLRTTGVFVLPNARFEFDGQAAADNPFDAQFFTRTLNFSGQGILNLQPDPRNAVPTPIPGELALIR